MYNYRRLATQHTGRIRCLSEIQVLLLPGKEYSDEGKWSSQKSYSEKLENKFSVNNSASVWKSLHDIPCATITAWSGGPSVGSTWDFRRVKSVPSSVLTQPLSKSPHHSQTLHPLTSLHSGSAWKTDLDHVTLYCMKVRADQLNCCSDLCCHKICKLQ